jgi:hypothetical protein
MITIAYRLLYISFSKEILPSQPLRGSSPKGRAKFGAAQKSLRYLPLPPGEVA